MSILWHQRSHTQIVRPVARPRRHDQLWPQVAWAGCARVGQSDEDARPPEEHLRLEEHLDLADALHHVRPPAPWVRCPGLATAPWERHRRDRASSATRYKAHARDPRSRLSRSMQVPWHRAAQGSSRERRLDPNWSILVKHADYYEWFYDLIINHVWNIFKQKSFNAINYSWNEHICFQPKYLYWYVINMK